MKKSAFLVAALLLFIASVAVPMPVQYPDPPPAPDDPKPGSGYTSCTMASYCKSCDAFRDRCISVTYSQYCACTNTPVEGSPGITTCDLDGSCTFRYR